MVVSSARLSSLLLAALLAWPISAETISEINGPQFLSPFAGQDVTEVVGLVTAKGPNGIWLRSTKPDSKTKTSDSIYVYGKAFVENVATGDIVSIDGRVDEYRSSDDYLYLTEIASPELVDLVSNGNEVTPLIIGQDTPAPPTEQYTSLDEGDIFGLPNNASLLSEVNPVLQPRKFGLDFWESLSGELVTVRKPTAVSKPNNYGDTWVTGDWKVSGRNERGGLTILPKDANPEAILIGEPLDGTDNPADVKLGDTLEEITGVVTYAFGFYRILPETAITVTGSAKPTNPRKSELVSTGSCNGLTIGDYNVENLYTKSAHLPTIAAHIVDYLRGPDLMFLQEIQDNNGPTDDDVVSANETLSTLVEAIESAGGPVYDFVNVDPEPDKDGGQPGGNIRVAYLYNPSILSLYKPNPGESLDATAIQPDGSLTFNPGRIDPSNAAWTNSRKPLAAAWAVLDADDAAANVIYTVNVHFGSKGGSTSLHGDARPPVNGGVEDRLAQAEVAARFLADVQATVPDARVLAAGDFNEFSVAPPLRRFAALSGMAELDAVVGVPPVERYSYVYDMNSQQLDHMFVSPALERHAAFEHVHLSSWVTGAAEVSDHDAAVARVDVCLPKRLTVQKAHGGSHSRHGRSS